jgi:hypothetical protein
MIKCDGERRRWCGEETDFLIVSLIISRIRRRFTYFGCEKRTP